MPPRGVYANRNAGHRARRAALYTQAATDWDRLRVSFDSFLAAVRLLQRRRQPLGTPPGTHDTTALRLVREATRYLSSLADQIDTGQFDATKQKDTA